MTDHFSNSLKLVLNFFINIVFSSRAFFIIAAQQRPRIVENPSDALATRDEPLTLNCKGELV